jgi:hypothetical protein
MPPLRKQGLRPYTPGLGSKMAAEGAVQQGAWSSPPAVTQGLSGTWTHPSKPKPSGSLRQTLTGGLRHHFGQACRREG